MVEASKLVQLGVVILRGGEARWEIGGNEMESEIRDREQVISQCSSTAKDCRKSCVTVV